MLTMGALTMAVLAMAVLTIPWLYCVQARGMAVEQERQVREDLEPMEIALQRSEDEQLALGDELDECQARKQVVSTT